MMDQNWWNFEKFIPLRFFGPKLFQRAKSIQYVTIH